MSIVFEGIGPQPFLRTLIAFGYMSCCIFLLALGLILWRVGGLGQEAVVQNVSSRCRGYLSALAWAHAYDQSSTWLDPEELWPPVEPGAKTASPWYLRFEFVASPFKVPSG